MLILNHSSQFLYPYKTHLYIYYFSLLLSFHQNLLVLDLHRVKIILFHAHLIPLNFGHFLILVLINELN